jgi:hypothetical protein
MVNELCLKLMQMGGEDDFLYASHWVLRQLEAALHTETAYDP